MSKPRKKKKKKASKNASLLTRLFKSGKKSGSGAENGSDGNAKTAGEGRAGPGRAQTPLERSIQEIKQLAKVGESDPERLALLLSNLLGAHKEKTQQDQQVFDQMVWDIVKRNEAAEEDGDDEAAAGSTATA